MSDQDHISTYHTPEELKTIRENVKSYCRINNILDRIYQITEELQGIEDELSFYLDPIFDNLCRENSPQEQIKGLLQIIGEEGRTGFNQKDLDWLKDRVEGCLPDDSPEKEVDHG